MAIAIALRKQARSDIGAPAFGLARVRVEGRVNRSATRSTRPRAFLIERGKSMTTQSAHHHLYAKQRWRNRARYQLRKFPLCAMCLKAGAGIVEPATVADHVIPHHGDEQLFWFGELQSLCSRHHASHKRHIERSGPSGYSKGKAIIGPDGYPIE